MALGALEICAALPQVGAEYLEAPVQILNASPPPRVPYVHVHELGPGNKTVVLQGIPLRNEVNNVRKSTSKGIYMGEGKRRILITSKGQ